MSTKRNDNPFIPVFDSIAEHDKTYDLADSLGVGRAQAVGVLVLLWQWMQKNRPDGVIPKPRPSQIATACLWDGDPQLLLDCLVSSGYLIQVLPAGVGVPNWWEGGGRLIKRRRADRDRKAGSPPREFRRNSAGTPTVDEKREDEKRTHPPTPQGVECVPPGFAEFWEKVPRRIAEAKARIAFSMALTKVELPVLLVATAAWAAASKGKAARYIPHPANWLDDERWGDDSDDSDEREADAKKLKRDRSKWETEHAHIEGVIRERGGPTQALIEKMNVYRVRLGWEPKVYQPRDGPTGPASGSIAELQQQNR